MELRKLRKVNVELDGDVVCARRQALGLTVKGLAELAGVTGAYISLIETKPDRAVSPPVHLALAKALDVDPELLRRKPAPAAVG